MNHSSSVRPSSSAAARHHAAAWRFLAALILTQGVWAATPVLAKPEAAKPAKVAKEKEYGYSQMLEDVDSGKVSKIVDVTGETRRTLKVSFKGKAVSRDVLMFDSLESNRQLYEKTNFFKRLATANVGLESQPRAADNSGLQGLLFQLGLLVLALFALSAIIKRSTNASGQAMNFGKSRARFQMQAKTGVMFDDVAGVNEAKEELAEVVTFLQQPEKFTALGAKIPRGVLLVGSPGTGKTLMAKAIAGEAGVPFFSISGSEFVEMFVGVGASRVRDLFKKAKENAPCLIFIDEIDAVGRQRGVGIGGGNDEREQTLNQLLTEMDGFEGNLGVIVIAATNRPDVLDAALLRPGRFDRQVTVDLPDYKGRLSILEVHARTKKMQEGLSLESVARRTIGFSGADLANMLNEAAIFTARRRKDAITIHEIDDAIDRVQAGMEGKAIIDGKFKRQTAYHEIGHALLITLLPEHDPLHKVTVIPRGRAIGLTWSTPSEEFGLENRTKLLSRIMVSLGGRVAEEIVFGETEVDSGADSDIQQLTRIARFMVSQVGMSTLGLVALNTDEKDYSEDIAAQIDREMRAIVKKCHQQATEILADYRPLMDSLVDVLIDQETIDGEEFRELVDKYIAENGKAPRPKAAEPVAV